MKVYVITSGDYSDYSIYGVASTKSKAEAIIAAAKGADEYWAQDARIEEYPVDEMLTYKQFVEWHCGMLLDDGSVVEQHDRVAWAKPFRSRVEQFNVKVPFYQNRPIVRVKSAVSQAHANKVAAEKRQEWLRTKAVEG